MKNTIYSDVATVLFGVAGYQTVMLAAELTAIRAERIKNNGTIKGNIVQSTIQLF